MSVTEEHLGIGTWDLTLRPGTPGRILNACRHFSKLFVTPTHTPTFTVGDVEDNAMYCGLKFGHSGPTRNRLQGYGLGALMGPSPSAMDWTSIPGASPNQATDADTFAELIRTHVIGWTRGITEGTLGTGVTVKTIGLGAGTSPLEYLDRICNLFGNEWKLNPDGTLDARNGDTMFGTDPVALLSDLGGGKEHGIQGYYSEIDVAEDVDDYSNIGLTAYDPYKHSTAIEADAHYDVPQLHWPWSTDNADEPGGFYISTGSSGSPKPPFRLSYYSEAAEGGTTGAVDDLLATLYEKNTGVHREVKVSILDGYAVRRTIEPGNYVAVWHLWAGLYDQTSPYQYRGQYIFPILARVKAITWPFEQGMGVWLRDSSSSLELHDLTPYVMWETGQPTTLDVGANPRGVDPGVFQRTA